MFGRPGVIMLNTYREAVRARVLHGLFALAIATGGYSIIVGEFASRSKMRVVSDLGAATISIYGIVVAVVLGASSLYRELELKTIFPILTRPIHRWEYLFGKYIGTLLTVFVFVAANAGGLLIAVGNMSGRPLWQAALLGPGLVLGLGVYAWRVPRHRTYVPILGALLLLLGGFWLSGGAPDERNVIAGGALLTLLEVMIVAAVATLFAAFSSPFLTAVFTFSVFVVGRSADTLASMPERVFGPTIKRVAEVLSWVFPNLMVYVPPRPLLTGEAGEPILGYLASAGLQSLLWSLGLLAAASLIFRRRDFL
ncbi:MAG: ABC transporter permease subunit [Polyangiaceae bacterium]